MIGVKIMDKQLYQEITDVCAATGGVTKPMVDELYVLMQARILLAYSLGMDDALFDPNKHTPGELGERNARIYELRKTEAELAKIKA